MNMPETIDTINAQVLVVGGGFAGLWAAIRATDFCRDVVLVEKAKVGRSGCSTFASGVQLCPTAADDLDVWKKEIVEAGEFFPDQEWVDIFLQNQIQRIQDYQRWGAPLERDSNGNVARILGRGHINTRLFQFHGPGLVNMLRKQAVRKGVRLVERVMITDLLTLDGLHPSRGRVVGAVGIDTRESAFRVFHAGAVVLATGPISGKRCNVDDVCTADGLVSGFRAGAMVANMEFCTSGNINVWQRKTSVGGINMIQGHGGKIVNSLGERFMEKYDPVLMERSLLYKLCLAFARESLEGRGPIMVDIRHLPVETLEKFRRVIPRTMKIWDGLGVDVSRETLECTPSWALRSASGEGGLKIDLCAATSLPGLYAAGAATRNPVQGIYALGGVATASCNVLGFVAGENAARYALAQGPARLDAAQVHELKETALAPLRRNQGPEPAELFQKLDESVVPAPFSMFKSASRIVGALAAIEKIKEELPRLRAADGHELVRANEFRNYAGCAELIFRAALERKESRQYHYREDYPYRDDINWLKLVVLQRQGHSLAVKFEPIPLEKWRYQPVSQEKVSHPVQVFLGTA